MLLEWPKVEVPSRSVAIRFLLEGAAFEEVVELRDVVEFDDDDAPAHLGENESRSRQVPIVCTRKMVPAFFMSSGRTYCFRASLERHPSGEQAAPERRAASDWSEER